MRMRSWFLLFYFLLQCVQTVFSQELNEKDFTLYSQQQGLSNNNVTGIAQDKRGYLWVSTRKGLNRYNGNEFVQFHTDSSSNSLPVEEIYSLHWLDEYRLLALTMGVHIINTGNGSFSNIIVPPGKLKYAFKVNNVVAVCSNKQADIFIITKSGFYHYNKNNELVYRFDYYKEEEAETTAFGFADDMVLLNENLVLIKAIDGSYTYDAKAHIIKKINRNDQPLFSDFDDLPNHTYLLRQIRTGSFIVLKLNTDTAIYIDFIKHRKIINRLPINPLFKEFQWQTELSKINDTLFYINSFTTGFYKMIINEATGEIKLGTEKYFPKYNCKTIFKDRENRLWIGTDKGIFKEQSKKAIATSTEIGTDIPHQLPAPRLHEIFVIGDKIFAASLHEGGLLVFDKNSLKLLQRLSLRRSPAASNNVYSISKFNDDTLLIGTLGPLFWLKISTLKYGAVTLENWDMEHYWVAAQLKDTRGNNWVTSNGNDVYQYKSSDKKFTRLDKNNLLNKILVARDIAEDRDKNIWLTGDGLCRYNTSTNRFDTLIDSFPFIRFPRKDIVGLAIDKNNIIWFGNAYNGLISYDISTHAFRQFTNQNGLPDNLIKALLVVKDKLWIACPSGIACLDLITNKIAAYGKDDGFPEVPVTGNNFFYDSAANQLYIGCENYLVRFNPDSLLQQDPPPSFFIESIQFANDKTFFYPAEKITVPYFNNNFSVSVGSINYNDVQNQRFVYRILNNADSNWKMINGQPLINFNNLSPGTYRLQVKLYAANNRWPEQVKFFTIIITPPFWQTWWFRILCILISGVLIFWLVRARIKNIRKKNNIDKQLAELEMKGLHAQMNPHFMFNALNSIKDMILHDEKNNASRYLSKFAQLIRLTLEHSQQTFITLGENIEHLKYYLEMEQLRFADLDYEIKTEPSIDINETVLPPMLLQPLVENAVWHGLLPKQGNKKVEIRFLKQNNVLVCEVEDNGIGINTSLKNKTKNINRSFGIENIMQRMKVLNEKYKLHYLFSVKDKKEIPSSNGTGTIATLSLPLNS